MNPELCRFADHLCLSSKRIGFSLVRERLICEEIIDLVKYFFQKRLLTPFVTKRPQGGSSG